MEIQHSFVLIQEKIEALQAELQAVTNSKTMLEKELQEVITLTSTELEEYQEKVLELEDEVKLDHFVTVYDLFCVRTIYSSHLMEVFIVFFFFPLYFFSFIIQACMTSIFSHKSFS